VKQSLGTTNGGAFGSPPSFDDARTVRLARRLRFIGRSRTNAGTLAAIEEAAAIAEAMAVVSGCDGDVSHLFVEEIELSFLSGGINSRN
jgi:hypothetical protein